MIAFVEKKDIIIIIILQMFKSRLTTKRHHTYGGNVCDKSRECSTRTANLQ